MGKFKYLLTRYNSLVKIYIEDPSIPKKIILFVDWLFSFVLYGASLNDYFAYRFYKLRPNGKNEYITYRRFHRILKKFNDKEKIKYFRDKSLFNIKFANYLHRESLDLRTIDYKQFHDFFSENKHVFVKEVMGYRGQSVNMYSVENVNLKELFEQLAGDKNAHYIIENRLVEYQELASFHPESVNTLRLVTVYDDKNDKVNFMSARIRIGNKGNHVDNFHFEGIGANIDVQTGIIDSVGYNSKDEEFLIHPMTGKQIIGFQIPKWSECKDFVEKACRVIPEVRYVGWDVVLLDNGDFALLEANDNADHDFQQMHNRGMWKEYKKLIKRLS